MIQSSLAIHNYFVKEPKEIINQPISHCETIVYVCARPTHYYIPLFSLVQPDLQISPEPERLPRIATLVLLCPITFPSFPFLPTVPNTHKCALSQENKDYKNHYKRRPMHSGNRDRAKPNKDTKSMRLLPFQRLIRHRSTALVACLPFSSQQNNPQKFKKPRVRNKTSQTQPKTTVAMQLGIVIIRKERISIPMKCFHHGYDAFVSFKECVYIPPLGCEKPIPIRAENAKESL